VKRWWRNSVEHPVYRYTFMAHNATGNSKMKSVVAVSLAALAVLPLSGCIHGRSYSSLSGDYVGTGTYNRIEVGETTDDWVLAALGEPTRRSELEGGELWAYEYERTERSKGSVLLVIGGSSSEESSGGTYIEIKDGIVTDAWRD
jgi:outer membrane protein assembly factor BamE (lipoprotein component of BamABCDE complex)